MTDKFLFDNKKTPAAVKAYLRIFGNKKPSRISRHILEADSYKAAVWNRYNWDYGDTYPMRHA